MSFIVLNMSYRNATEQTAGGPGLVVHNHHQPGQPAGGPSLHVALQIGALPI